MEKGVLRRNYQPLFELTLQLDKNSKYPAVSTSPENDDVQWSLEYNNESDDSSCLRISRYGNHQEKDDDKFNYYHCNINAPDFAHYFEYFFFVGSCRTISMPKILFDDSEPISITCKVSKRVATHFHRAQSRNTLSETIEWFFPLRFDVKTWTTGFSLMWRRKESDRVTAFEVVLDGSGAIHFQTEEALPVDVHFWGFFKKSWDRSNVPFNATLKKGELRQFVCDMYTALACFSNLCFLYMHPTMFIRADF